MRDCAQLAMRTRRPRRALVASGGSRCEDSRARRNVQAVARAAVALRNICHSRGAPFMQTAAPPTARFQSCKPPLNATAHKRAANFAKLGGERRGNRANKRDTKVLRQLYVTNHFDTARDLAAAMTAAAVLAFVMAAGAIWRRLSRESRPRELADKDCRPRRRRLFAEDAPRSRRSSPLRRRCRRRRSRRCSLRARSRSLGIGRFCASAGVRRLAAFEHREAERSSRSLNFWRMLTLAFERLAKL